MGEVEACRHSSGKAEPAASQVAIRRITQKKFARQPKRIETRGAMASSIAKLRHAFVFYRRGRWRRLRTQAEKVMEEMGNSMGVNWLSAVEKGHDVMARVPSSSWMRRRHSVGRL